MPSTMATYVYASSQGQRTHSARTNLPYLTIFSPAVDILVNLIISCYINTIIITEGQQSSGKIIL